MGFLFDVAGERISKSVGHRTAEELESVLQLLDDADQHRFSDQAPRSLYGPVPPEIILYQLFVSRALRQARSFEIIEQISGRRALAWLRNMVLLAITEARPEAIQEAGFAQDGADADASLVHPAVTEDIPDFLRRLGLPEGRLANPGDRRAPSRYDYAQAALRSLSRQWPR